ncbi:hypothetical protein WJX81_003817 [Elliptochloris bilobata]|uniref:Ribokinase n=1 Tax=Elliptochloris bilobata TaxID=381761 RepID=A0AAW1S7F0_9CHLO
MLCPRRFNINSALQPHACAATKPLLVVGSMNMDLVLRVDRLPAAGETISASSLETFPGGKGANQAAAAARLGHPTSFYGQVGTDQFTEALPEHLRATGCQLTLLRQVEGPTGTAVILLQPDGENSIIIVGGANTAEWDIGDQQQQAIRGAGGVLLQREVPESVNVSVAELAAAAGVPVLLDCGGREGPVNPRLLAALAVLTPNETELARMTGMPVSTEAEAVAAARQLQARHDGGMAVLVKRGAAGCTLVPPGGAPPISQAAFPVQKVVDTTGAGDCFTGAYAVALLEGQAPQAALRFAAAAAALCVQTSGAMPSMPKRESVAALLEEG